MVNQISEPEKNVINFQDFQSRVPWSTAKRTRMKARLDQMINAKNRITDKMGKPMTASPVGYSFITTILLYY